MGCRMTLTVETGDAAAAEHAFDTGQEMVEEAEQCLSRFRPESELCRLNAQTGVWTAVSPLLLEVLRRALGAAEQTGGLCTPAVLDALETAGYDRDFSDLGTDLRQRDRPRVGVASRPAGARAIDGRGGCAQRGPRAVARRHLRPIRPATAPLRAWRAVRLDLERSRARLPLGCRLDLAGVAKGWTADRVADHLATVGPCVVDAGGDIAVRGRPYGLAGWPLSVVDPRSPDDDLALVLLRDGGLATSGTDHRRWLAHGRSRHHLIDPRTARPARTDVLTASVIAPTTTDADVHAKVAILLGARGGLAYLRRQGLAGLLVRQDGHVLASPRWSAYVFTR
jgi:thiamine biosynthesis lipoprotein